MIWFRDSNPTIRIIFLFMNPDNKITLPLVIVSLAFQNVGWSLSIQIAKLFEGIHPELEFHFIGNQAPNFQDYWEPIMKDLPSNVKVWGEKDNVSDFMCAADVLMFNSTWECNPLVLREGISYGLKILSRNLL